MIDYDKLQKSLKHLELQYGNYTSLAPDLSQLMREGIAESVIQRFETCYDSLWKALKRYLREELGLADLPNSPKPLFRIAFENKLLRSDIEQWLRYADARTSTAHDYSENKAKEALALMGQFIIDAVFLYQRMSGKNWI